MAKYATAIVVAICAFTGVALATFAVEETEYGSAQQLLLISSAAIILVGVAAWTGWSIFKRW
ncbi:hypothetical protein CN195_04720 [Sinorhizobium meliloti]|nr:hypothetical protein CN195_04720 [Sinorhizobium meliloti]